MPKPRGSVGAALVEAAGEGDELGGVLEGVVLTDVVLDAAGRVAAEREDVADAGGGVLGEDFVDLGLVVADAGKVRDGVELGFVFDADDEVVGQLPGGAAGAVGDGNEGGLESLQMRNVGV